jgi:hypothetical protein
MHTCTRAQSGPAAVCRVEFAQVSALHAVLRATGSGLRPDPSPAARLAHLRALWPAAVLWSTQRASEPPSPQPTTTPLALAPRLPEPASAQAPQRPGLGLPAGDRETRRCVCMQSAAMSVLRARLFGYLSERGNALVQSLCMFYSSSSPFKKQIFICISKCLSVLHPAGSCAGTPPAPRQAPQHHYLSILHTPRDNKPECVGVGQEEVVTLLGLGTLITLITLLSL